MDGMNIVTARNTPNWAYSASGNARAFERKCIAVMKRPPAMVANMSQPL